MSKPKIAVFSGPRATVNNSPPLVTSNKGRLIGERLLPGTYDHLVPQILYEPIKVRIRKYSAHPLEADAQNVYHDDGKDYYEVELRPEDGPYLLPYVARRANGTPHGAPFEAEELTNAALNFGGRQLFYPDASRVFAEIDRTISGRDQQGEGSTLDRKAHFDFIRVLPPGGYTRKGEMAGVDYFPYKPIAHNPRYNDLAKVTNVVQATMRSGQYVGAIWLEGSPRLEETLYWLNLLIDSDLPIVGVSSQRPHGQLANDGDRNIVDAVDCILSLKGKGLGAVGVIDEQIFAARDFKKGDARPGGYKSTGGHGGILGSVGPPVTIWYKPAYNHTSSSIVNLTRLPEYVEFDNYVGDSYTTRIRIKNEDGSLREQSIPRVHIVKTAAYMEEDETHNPDHEVDILARVERGLIEENTPGDGFSRFHGFVLEGYTSPNATGTGGQMAALAIAAASGMPVVRVRRSDPGGRVATNPTDLTIEGSNLDTNKARLLLMASVMKLGRLPRAKDPRHLTSEERSALVAKIRQYQEIFESH